MREIRVGSGFFTAWFLTMFLGNLFFHSYAAGVVWCVLLTGLIASLFCGETQ